MTVVIEMPQHSCSRKAIEAAIQARQWGKAVQIVELQEPSISAEYYQQIAEHYHSVKDHPLAEQYYLKADLPLKAVDMYVASGQWEEAHRLAGGCMEPGELQALYIGTAGELEGAGKLREAERLLVIVGEPDLAVSMYKKHKQVPLFCLVFLLAGIESVWYLLQYDPMVRLIAKHHPDLLVDTHLHLAKVLYAQCSSHTHVQWFASRSFVCMYICLQELEGEGQWRQAEQHFVQGEDWKAAVNMYRSRELWDDAYRVRVRSVCRV